MATNAAESTRPAAPAAPARPVQDEWGLYDPHRAGMQAVMRAMKGPQPVAPAAPGDAQAAAVPPAPAPAIVTPPPGDTAAAGAPVSAAQAAADRAAGGALYTLEAPARCPECHSQLRTVRVLRLLRTQVSFTSTLPRKGYVIVCPDCERLLAAELAGLV